MSRGLRAPRGWRPMRGTTPRVHASGGKSRFGPPRPDVNRYLKWAFVEAANAICLHRGRAADRHVSRLYERLARRKGHAKAIGAVGRGISPKRRMDAQQTGGLSGTPERRPCRPRGISARGPMSAWKLDR